MGAEKIYGLDISQEMIDQAQKELTELNLIDSFDLICHDIFDETFQLADKVDCVVLSYTLSTFICNMEMLVKMLTRCKSMIKDDGCVFVADFSWVVQPCDDWFFGMYTKTITPNGPPPKEFEPFHFQFDKDPEHPYEIFEIPSHLMYQAALQAGFGQIDTKLAYSHPDFRDHPAMKR